MQMNWSIDRDGILKSLQIWNFTNLTSKTSSLHIRHSWQFLVDIFLRFSGVILSGKPLLFPFEFGVSLVEDQDLFIITYAQVFPFSKILVRIRNIVCLTFSLVSVTFCSVQSICSLHWLWYFNHIEVQYSSFQRHRVLQVSISTNLCLLFSYLTSLALLARKFKLLLHSSKLRIPIRDAVRRWYQSTNR